MLEPRTPTLAGGAVGIVKTLGYGVHYVARHTSNGIKFFHKDCLINLKMEDAHDAADRHGDIIFSAIETSIQTVSEEAKALGKLL